MLSILMVRSGEPNDENDAYCCDPGRRDWQEVLPAIRVLQAAAERWGFALSLSKWSGRASIEAGHHCNDAGRLA